MKYSFAIGAALAGQALAFPAAVMDKIASEASSPQAIREAFEKRQAFGVNVGFDPSAQYISTSGEHAFVAPGPTDLRGPCPGLNALANHGYLPHNGVANIQQFIDATTAVFGMGLDLATFLSVYGAVFDGDLLSWSIGGPPPASLVSPLAGLVGQPQGISGSHNKYEGDVSPVKPDLYQYGNDYLNIMDQFVGLYNLQSTETEETSNYDLPLLTAYRVTRFNQSLHENPYFFNGVFSGLLVQPAAYTFIYRFMANKSEEYPEGRLSQDVLKSFYAVTGDSPDNFEYTPGYERIPDNWYRRAFGDEYTIPFFLLDVLAAAEGNPQFLNAGGNTGTVNSFAGLDLQNLTGGVYDLSNLAEGNNLLCFSFQFVNQAGPDVLQGLLSNVGKATSLLSTAVGNVLDGLGCPQLPAIQNGQFAAAMSKYPGATQLSSDGKYSGSSSSSSSGKLLGIL